MRKYIVFFVIIVFSLFISPLFCNKLLSQENNNSTDQTNVLNGYSKMCLDASNWDGTIDVNGLCGCGLDENGKCSSGCHVNKYLGCVKTCGLTHAPESGFTGFTLTNKEPNKFPSGSIVYPALEIPLNRSCFTDFTEEEKTTLPDFYYTTTILENDYSLYCHPETDLNCREKISCLVGNIQNSLIYDENPSGIFYADNQGNIEIQGGTTYGVVDHSHIFFYALYPPQVMASGGADASITGQANSQQQGRAQFVLPIFEDTNTKQDCVEITWDPYGRVFDSQSLEPMSGVKVRLLNEIKPSEKITFVTSGNPVTTKSDGVFNFVVKPGTYYLRLADIPNTHTFSPKPNLNPKYKYIYKKFANNVSSIYVPDQPINEIIDTPEEAAKGKPDLEERDIALDPGKNKPYTFPITHIELTQSLEGDYIVFRGKASHPFPLLTIKDEYGNILLNKKEFTDDQARYGFWSLSLKASSLPTNTTLIPILTKNPKYFVTDSTVNIIDKNSPRFEPILRSIEGYAYDDKGKVIPNIKVAVKLYMTGTEFASTVTDSSGYFSFNSLKLPPFSYYLEYDNKIKTTSNFVKDNQSYLKSNNIDLMALKINQSISENGNRNSANNFFGNASKGFQDVNNPVLKNNQSAKTAQVSPFKKELILIVVILSFLLVSILMLVFYIKKHKKL